MRRHFRPFSSVILGLTLIVPTIADDVLASTVFSDETRAVDVVICLDTSGSMENLLDSARARLWDVVNELARLSPTPELRVGLLTFGTDESSAPHGWIVEQLDLTDDLDTVYAEMMSLTTAGSEEYVGRVLHTALDNMSWSDDWNGLRIIFIAGNESADQGVEDYDFRVSAKAAHDEDIIINALYAGNREQGVVEKWHEIAQHGGGNFSAIDPASGTIQIATPQDDQLLDLNARLNTTYVPYGSRGQAGLANQVAQDSNASRLGVQSCSSRIVAKGSALYTNASWDLVDAGLDQDFRWDSLNAEDLPEKMRSMTDEELVAYVDGKRAERESIQQEIQRISEEREAYVRSVLAQSGAVGLGEAMRDAIREQAMTKGFECDGC